MTTRPTSQRGNSGVTKSEFSTFTDQVFNRLDELGKKIELMLPREIYQLRERQIIEDTQEITQRVTAAEKAITELSAQISTTRLATVNDTRSVEHQVASSRFEAQNRLYDLLKNILMIAGGALMSYLATRGH